MELSIVMVAFEPRMVALNNWVELPIDSTSKRMKSELSCSTRMPCVWYCWLTVESNLAATVKSTFPTGCITRTAFSPLVHRS